MVDVVSDAYKYMMLTKWLFFYNIFGVVVIGTVKISIAFFLLRIALDKWYRRFLWFMIGELEQWFAYGNRG